MSAAAFEKPDAQTLFDNIRLYIRDAHEICDRGEFIELSGLDMRVRELCDAIERLETEEAVAYAEDLQAVMDELGALQAIFQQKRDALGEELTGANKHQQAARAYKQSERGIPATGDGGDSGDGGDPDA